VSQIVSACEELSDAVFKSSNIYVFLLGEMGTFSKTWNKSCVRKGIGLNNVIHVKSDFS
jgi:hypothetical protein